MGGISLYARAFTLTNQSNDGYGAAATAGTAGNYTKHAGTLAYQEVCEMLGDGGRYINDSHVAAPVYITPLHRQWIAFEDETSVAIKADYATRKKGLAGIMVWNLPTDDFSGVCGEKYPLMRKIYSTLKKKEPPAVTDPVVTNEGGDGEGTEKKKFKCTQPGLHADPGSCDHFYNCDNALVGHRTKCAAGTLFDVKLSNCNHTNLVKCGSTQS